MTSRVRDVCPKGHENFAVDRPRSDHSTFGIAPAEQNRKRMNHGWFIVNNKDGLRHWLMTA